MKKTLTLAALLLAAATGPLRADTIITESSTGGGSSTPEKATIYITPDRFALQQGSGGMIFLANDQVLWQYDTSQSSYLQFTPKSMKQLKAKSDAIVAQEIQSLKQQMQSMPSDQQAAMQKAINQMQQSAHYTFKRLGPDRSVAGYRCTPVEVFKNGQSQIQLCMAPVSELGISPKDMRSVDALETFYKNFGPDTAGMFDLPGLKSFLGFRGFPVEETDRSTGGTTVTVVESVSHKHVPDSVFTLPPGLTKQSLLGSP